MNWYLVKVTDAKSGAEVLILTASSSETMAKWAAAKWAAAKYSGAGDFSAGAFQVSKAEIVPMPDDPRAMGQLSVVPLFA